MEGEGWKFRGCRAVSGKRKMKGWIVGSWTAAGLEHLEGKLERYEGEGKRSLHLVLVSKLALLSTLQLLREKIVKREINDDI